MMAENLEAFIITDEKNMHYYTGFYKGEGYVAVCQDKCFVVTDFRYTEFAEANCPGCQICDISKTAVDMLVPENAPCGFEDGKISYAKYVSLSKKLKNLVAAGNMADLPREVKDEEEIECIRAAAQIADKAFEHICSFIKEGMTEIEVACEIEHFMRKSGAEKTSFDTIVASGARGSLPHAIPSTNKLRNGDLVVMDYGCVVGGYASDMTRTVGIGKADALLMDVYNTVLSAQLEALNCIKAGVSGQYVDSVARTMLDFKYPGRFGHSLTVLDWIFMKVRDSHLKIPENSKAGMW